MTTLRSLLAYFADRHTAAIAAAFLFFSCVVFFCGRLGSAEVALRRATSPPSRDASLSAVTLAPITTLAFVALTEADVEMLNGGPLLPSASPTSLLAWDAAADAAMAARWHRRFALGDINIVSLPTAFAAHPVVRHWFGYLESRCVACHFLPLMKPQLRSSGGCNGDDRGWATGAPPINAQERRFSSWCFCSAARHTSTRSPSDAAAAAATYDEATALRGIDVLVLEEMPSLIEPSPVTGLPVGCGVVILLTPEALRAYRDGPTGDAHGDAAPEGVVNDTFDGTADFVALLGRIATSVDPPLPSSAVAVAAKGFREHPLDRREKTQQPYKFWAAEVKAAAAARLGYRPLNALVAAWCPSSRSFSFDAVNASSSSSQLGGQPGISVLCVRENEVIEVTPQLQRVVRVSEASAL